MIVRFLDCIGTSRELERYEYVTAGFEHGYRDEKQSILDLVTSITK